MKILIAPDKFKGSLSALEVCEAIGSGLKKQNKNFEIIYHPMADGGDGSLEILNQHLSLSQQIIETVNPLGKKITSHYFTSKDIAFIELASASGLVLLSQEERNPMLTSTFGTGLMIKDALSKGFKNIYLFLGGSATNDAGIGIANALGFDFFDGKKMPVSPTGENLLKIKSIIPPSDFYYKNINITLLCDVANPLFGKNGAAHIYASQKGATPEQVQLLDEGLRNFSNVITNQFDLKINQLKGSGAAGGIAASLVPLLNSKIEKGFEAIARLTELEEKIATSDYIISGEGKLDQQSLQGKVINGISNFCKKYQKPLSLIIGKNELGKNEMEGLKIQQVLSIFEVAEDLEDAMRNGESYLEQLASQLDSKI